MNLGSYLWSFESVTLAKWLDILWIRKGCYMLMNEYVYWVVDDISKHKEAFTELYSILKHLLYKVALHPDDILAKLHV